MLALGAPGVNFWQGALVYYETPTEADMAVILAREQTGSIPFFSYLGYATAVGRLFHLGPTEQIVLGAPRADMSGLVQVIGQKNSSIFEVLTTLYSEQFGSFFGAAVCVLDLNADGFDDLLVGAPLFSVTNSPGGDHGAVFVYRSQDEGILSSDSERLFGLKKPWARFGQAITNAGKLLNQYYNSFIIGAPYEDGGKGAIYIYTGIAKTFNQRIVASAGMRGFGYGISGNLDVDNNGYPDIAVGAYESDQAVLYLARPVVNVVTKMTFDEQKIDLQKVTYELGGKCYPSVRLMVQLSYTGVEVPESLEVEYTIETDSNREEITAARGWLVEGSKTLGKVTNRTVLQKEQMFAITYIVVFEKPIKNLNTPFDCKLTFKTVDQEFHKASSLVPMLNATKATHVYTSVLFNICGKDDRCHSELQLRQIVETPTKKDVLILGDERPLVLVNFVKNLGEAAFQTVVEFKHPVELRFRSVSDNSSSSSTRVSCFLFPPTNGYPTPVSQSVLQCQVGNPLYTNQTVEFRVIFDAQKITEYENPLTIITAVNTTNHQTLLANDIKITAIPLVISTKLEMGGASKPDQLRFQCASEGKTSKTIQSTYNTSILDAANNKMSNDVAFEHYYSLTNNGPGLLPRTNYHVNIPHKTSTGQRVALKTEVTIITYRESSTISMTCDLLAHQLKEFPVAKPQRKMLNLIIKYLMEPSEMDFSSMHYVSYHCPITDLRPTETALIKVALHMGISQIVTGKIIHFFTEARLTTNMTKIEDDASETDQLDLHTEYYLVTTTLYPVFRRVRINWWVFLMAAGVGTFLLAILIVIFHRCGFFKRRRPYDAQRLEPENADD